jgi:hypothetical protein
MFLILLFTCLALLTCVRACVRAVRIFDWQLPALLSDVPEHEGLHERQDDVISSSVPRNFFLGGGVQQIQLRTEGRENGDLGAVAP